MMRRPGAALASVPVLILASLALVAFCLFAFPTMSEGFQIHTPAGAAYDTELFYSPAQAISKADLYDAADRAFIARLHWTYDLAFPLAYGLCLASAWAVGLRLLGGDVHAPRYRLIAVPLAAMAFDILENAAVTLLLGMAPTAGDNPVSLALIAGASMIASISTTSKWVLVAISVVGAIVLPLAGILIDSWRKHNPHHQHP